MKRIIAYITVFLAAVSCNRDESVAEGPAVDDREIAVSLGYQVESMNPPATKSAYISDSFDDEMITGITVAVYDKSTGALHYRKHFYSGFDRMEVRLHAGTAYDLYALANMGDRTADLPTDRNTLLSEYVYMVPSYGDVNDRGIPMTGKIENYVAGSGTAASFNLRRLFAKVVLSVTTEFDGGSTDGVRVDSLRIGNGNGLLSAFGNSRLLSPSDRLALEDYALNNTVNAGQVVFYVPENRQGIIGNASSSRDKNPDTNTEVNAVRDLLTYVDVVVSANSTYYTGRVSYRSYVGANATTDFNVIGNCVYHWNMTLTEDGLVYDDWKTEQDIEDGRQLLFLADPILVEASEEVKWMDILSANLPWTEITKAYGGIAIYDADPDANGFVVRNDVAEGDVMTASLRPTHNSRPSLETETNFRVVNKYIYFDSDIYEVNPRKTVASYIVYGNSYSGNVTGSGGLSEADASQWIAVAPENLSHSDNGTNCLDYEYAYDSSADSVMWTPARYAVPGDYLIVCRTMNDMHCDSAILRVCDTRWINTNAAYEGLPWEKTIDHSGIDASTVWNIGYAYGDLSVSDDTGRTSDSPNSGYFAGHDIIGEWEGHIGHSFNGNAEEYLALNGTAASNYSEYSVSPSIPIGDYVYRVYWKDTWNEVTGDYAVRDSAVLHITGTYITGISVIPTTLTIRKGETLSVRASIQPRNASLQKVSWEVVSGNGNVSVVSSDDLQAAVTGLQEGTATVRAIASDGSGVQSRNVCTITVTNPPVSLTVLPAEDTIYMGTTLQYNAIATLYDGSLSNVTSRCRWTTSNRNVATIGSNDGIAVAGSTTIGSCIVTASYNITNTSALTATATLNVVERPTPVSLDYLGDAIYLLHNISNGVSSTDNTHNLGSLPLRLNYADGTSITGTVSSLGAILSTSATDIITISGRNRILTNARGIASVTISCDGLSTDVNVCVSSYRLTPSTANSIYINTGKSQTFNCYITPYDQTAEVPFAVYWNVRNEAGFGQIAVTEDYGSSTRVMGRAAGTAWLSVDYDGEYGTVSLEYTIQIQNSGGSTTTYYLEVVPESVTLNEGENARFTALYHTITGGSDDGGVEVSAAWSIFSGSEYISLDGSSGLVTAISQGRARIMASYSGKAAYATVIVSNLPPVITHYLEIMPEVAMLEVGSTQQFTAIYHTVTNGFDDGGVTVSPVWGSSDNDVATVDAGGTVTARARGTATIIGGYTADGETYTAAAAVTVATQFVEVYRLELTPEETTIAEGASLTYVVRKYTDIYSDGILSVEDQLGVVIPNTDVNWTVLSGGSFVNINSSGVATGLAAGDATVKASCKNDTSVTATAMLHIDNVYNVDPGTGGSGTGGGNY